MEVLVCSLVEGAAWCFKPSGYRVLVCVALWRSGMGPKGDHPAGAAGLTLVVFRMLTMQTEKGQKKKKKYVSSSDMRA